MADWSSCYASLTVPNDPAGADQVATIKCLEPLFANLVSAVMALSGIALFIMLVTGGFSFLFAAGDPKKLEQAQKTISTAIGGLVLMISAYLIIRIIAVFTGIDALTTFTIPSF